MTIDYGQTVRYIWVGISILIRGSICLGIQHFQPQQWWFQPSRKVITAIWARKNFFNTKLAKVWIQSEHCIGFLKALFQHLRGYWWVICDKADLDDGLKVTLCTCMLHILLIEHPVTPDWFNKDIAELEQED